MKIRKFTYIVLLSLILGLFVIGILNEPINSAGLTDRNTLITKSGWEAQADWHEGSDISTSEVNLEYQQDFNTLEGQGDFLYQNMFFTYKDGTSTRIGMQIVVRFGQGGLDVRNRRILNWSKVIDLSFNIICDSRVNSVEVRSEYAFNGFYIVKGTAKDVQIVKNEDHEQHTWGYSIENVLGDRKSVV